MKRIFVGIAAAALALSLAACGSTGQAAKDVSSQGPIDWQGREFGKPIPEWVELVSASDTGKLKKMPEFSGKQLLPLSGQGNDRDLTFADIGSRQALAELSRRIESSVATKVESAISGNKDAEEGTAAKVTEQLSGAFSKTRFSGLEEIATFWTLVRKADGGTEYRCYSLYGMNDDLYERQVSKVINGVKSQARTPEEQNLLDKLDAMTWKLEQER